LTNFVNVFTGKWSFAPLKNDKNSTFYPRTFAFEKFSLQQSGKNNAKTVAKRVEMVYNK
jgi:hypothetical protein